MKKRQVCAWMMTLLLALSLVLPGFCQPVSAAAVLETTVTTASDGCTMLGVAGSYYSQAQAALDRINAIRKEACEAGNVPDPRNKSRMLTASDYVPLKWSTDLESAARIRAVEGGLAYGFMGSGHNSLNKKSHWNVTYNNVGSCYEDLAYNWGTSMVSGVNQWYGEKDDWVAQTSGAVTGHYTSMIDPSCTYVGLGDFYTESAEYPNTLAGEFSRSSSSLDQTMQTAQTDVIQKIEVSDDYISGYVLDGVDTIYTDETTTLTPMAQLVNGSNTLKLLVLGDVTYESSDSTIATVTNDAVVTGVRAGTATITAHFGESESAAVQITVKCGHDKELVSYTAPTCTAAGVKVYRCELCGGTVEQTVAKTAHSYVYGQADSSGVRTGVCSGCGDTISIVPPTTYTLYWRNSTSSSQYYWSYFPTDNPVGSVVYCWLMGVDGDSGYQNFVIESTDSSVISVPDTVYADTSTNKLSILAPGITTLTIYAQYNPSLKQTITVRIGEDGSVNMGSAEVTLSDTVYKYTGTACTPSVSVSYHDTVLTKGKDYTVTYENNTDLGTASVVITGAGIFKGSVRKNFSITQNGEASSVTGTSEEQTTTGGSGSGTSTGSASTSEEQTTTGGSGSGSSTGTSTSTGSGTSTGSASTSEEQTTTSSGTSTTTGSDVEEVPKQKEDTVSNGNAAANSTESTTKIETKKTEDEDTGNAAQDVDDEENEDNEEDEDDAQVEWNVGDSFEVKGLSYRITSISSQEKCTVVCTGFSSQVKTSLQIPSSVSYDELECTVTGIDSYAFAGCKKVKSVMLGAELKTIGKKAFYGCSSLRKIVIPQKVDRIGAQAFAQCSKLRTVQIRSTALTKQRVGKKAFWGIHKKAVATVPAKQRAQYRKWLPKKGISVRSR